MNSTMRDRDNSAATESRPTMRALIQPSIRGPGELTLRTDVPRPRPGPTEVLVRVSAAGVNFADVLQSRGTYGGGPTPPYVAGFEAAGEVVEVGSKVLHGPTPGTRVIGTGAGAFAEYLTMPAAGTMAVPDGWTEHQSLGLVLNAATALAALTLWDRVGPGSVVLVHAAAGGVGQAAVRLARHLGARVIATASPAKHDVVRALGAEVLDGTRADLAEQIRHRACAVDLVLESVGQATFRASLAVVKPFTGRIVVFGAASGEAVVSTHDLVYRHPVQLAGLHIGSLAAAEPQRYRRLLDELAGLIADGGYRPDPPVLHPLTEGPQLLQDLESRLTVGKHALDPRA